MLLAEAQHLEVSSIDAINAHKNEPDVGLICNYGYWDLRY
jgi:hypothetical protein